MSKLGLQMLAYGERQRADLPGVLAEIREVGYDGVEAGGDGRGLLPAAVLVTALRNAGLALTGVHVGYADCAETSKLEDRLALLQQAGARFLICSGVAERHTIAGYEAAADTFNAVGRQCRDAGLIFCYHNHAWEFERLEGGKQGLYTLLERTSPDLVKLAIDVFWVHVSGLNPAAFIATHSDRAGYYHFKDGANPPAGPTFIELGQGEVDLVGAREEALQHPLDWIVCEQDRIDIEPKVSIRQSLDYLKQLGL